MTQPPPRGCVLKLEKNRATEQARRQPPPRGCVLKHQNNKLFLMGGTQQPPPRGCVLKLALEEGIQMFNEAAASARLCVETLFR